mmetsp:Transcript_3369/g.5953  ORF Transcript_3369/g.5953 Transcript_3369/m.5953 type:complete len:130 (-) Transcript_3369:42-431(-)
MAHFPRLSNYNLAMATHSRNLPVFLRNSLLHHPKARILFLSPPASNLPHQSCPLSKHTPTHATPVFIVSAFVALFLPSNSRTCCLQRSQLWVAFPSRCLAETVTQLSLPLHAPAEQHRHMLQHDDVLLP